MLLESIETLGFRNLNGFTPFDHNLNIFTGANGQGKTNWLEAICVLALARSFRTARLQDTIAFGEIAARISGHVRQSDEIVRKMEVVVSERTKTLWINEKKEPSSRYLGQLHAIVFNSDELEIVRGQPDARRRFLDAGIVSLHPPFVQVMSDYSRVLRQKNVLLQSARDGGISLERVAESLGPWNEQLAKLAGRIHRARVRFVGRINEVLERRLFASEEVTIRYQSSLEGKGDLTDPEALLAERLAMRVQAEVVAGHALIGTHRDDMSITLDGHDLRRFGSAGQQRSALLLLQLANIAVFQATRGEYPLFLLDDIDAELDYQRIGRLLEFLDGKTQTFVTTSKESFVRRFGAPGRVLTIVNGSVNTA